MEEHTPGPWSREGEYAIYAGNVPVAIVIPFLPSGERMPAGNATLMVNALNLLEALEGMICLVNELSEYDPSHLPTYRKARDIIAKAKGV